MMNLYLIERTDDWDYDEYDSAVVAAETQDLAAPHVPFSLAHVTWKLLGMAAEGIEPGLILGSFNAG